MIDDLRIVIILYKLMERSDFHQSTINNHQYLMRVTIFDNFFAIKNTKSIIKELTGLAPKCGKAIVSAGMHAYPQD